jgi:RNA binding exosome subunit
MCSVTRFVLTSKRVYQDFDHRQVAQHYQNPILLIEVRLYVEKMATTMLARLNLRSSRNRFGPRRLVSFLVRVSKQYKTAESHLDPPIVVRNLYKV